MSLKDKRVKKNKIEYRLKLLEILSKNEFGLTISDIAKQINGNRNTVSKYLAILEAEQLIFKKDIGPASLYFSQDYESKILHYLKKNPSGLTVRDISNYINLSRDAVLKIISALEQQNKIYNKKMGPYNIYLSTKKDYIPKNFILSWYKGILKSFEGKFTNNKQVFKEIGRDMAKYLDPHVSSFLNEKLTKLKGNPIPKLHFDAFKEVYSTYDLFQPSVSITVLKIEKNKAMYRFEKSELLENSEDFIYHFYIMCGIAEYLISRESGFEVICKVENIYLSEDKPESFVDISIEIK